MYRNKILIFNFKLNDNINFINKIYMLIKKNIFINKYKILISPQILYLHYTIKKFNEFNNVYIVSQNTDLYTTGSYTGSISIKALKDIGIKYIIVGHFDRKKFFNEKIIDIVKKILLIYKYNMIPILLIGENKYEYENNLSIKTCINKINFIIDNLNNINIIKNILIIYYPTHNKSINNILLIKKVFLSIKNSINNKKILNSIKFLYNIKILNYTYCKKNSFLDGYLIETKDLKKYVKYFNLLNIF